ncbi:hypothetical protein FDECE_15998 [Fusarium decemcellulare]|nr:hypothetical protein FDECE_15998 [Fusarium decemcellulare]
MGDNTLHRDISNITFPLVQFKDNTLDDHFGVFPPDAPPSRLRRFPSTTICPLDAFPPEIIQDILPRLDLRSLINFRLANRRTAEIARSLPQFNAVFTHARHALRHLFAIRAARHVTCATLYEKLCTAECEDCGDFGGYLYLITCKRICFSCCTQNPVYLPIRSNTARDQLELHRSTAKIFPQMRVVPGVYSPVKEKFTGGIDIVDQMSALSAYVEQYCEPGYSIQDYGMHHRKVPAGIYVELTPPGPVPPQPQNIHIFFSPLSEQAAYVALSRVPWLDREAQEAEWGFHCVGCSRCSKHPLHYRRQYSTRSFLSHLEECGEVENGEHRGESGPLSRGLDTGSA